MCVASWTLLPHRRCEALRLCAASSAALAFLAPRDCHFFHTISLESWFILSGSYIKLRMENRHLRVSQTSWKARQTTKLLAVNSRT